MALRIAKGRVLQRILAGDKGLTGNDLLMIADNVDYGEAEGRSTNAQHQELYVQALVLAQLSEYLFGQVGGRMLALTPSPVGAADASISVAARPQSRPVVARKSPGRPRKAK